MKQYLTQDPWSIIEEGFFKEHNRVTESVMSLGNGRMGQRANFEEHYSGDTFQGSYIAGVYFPDKTRVGWWKNGYPEYFAKVLNSTNWIGLDLYLDNERLDLATAEIVAFRRELNMQKGYLQRSFTAILPGGKEIKVCATRFCSIADDECGAIRYSITPMNFSGELSVNAYLDADIINEDANYNEKFWNEVSQSAESQKAKVNVVTKKLDFYACTAMHFDIQQNGQSLITETTPTTRSKYASVNAKVAVKAGEQVDIYKYAAVLSSLNHEPCELEAKSEQALDAIIAKGFDKMLQEQADAWASKWAESDITIEGDISAQQGIRFNIFQLNQTYTGEDERLNIGPKGFTGEKYGGSTYWDTEAYCLPFYLSTADEHVARNLLVYRYQHLEKAIENAAKLGFGSGAALYPMVTMNGEECHNEWEITFEEIHRNGAIAYAIFNYIRYTGEKGYLAEYGTEVLVGIARFWAQRVNWSADKKQFVMLGVTGPNEYENNVNNNWYTSTLACWCLDYAREAIAWLKESNSERANDLEAKLGLRVEELAFWEHISNNMYTPESQELGIFLQQDGYLDKEQVMAKDIPAEEYPIHKHWSWDRILRSCFIKQPDVLLGMFFFEERYSLEQLERNFDFYEPRTVHESSLSPCIHNILACQLGRQDKAYQLYLRTSRLDLDNYNHDTEDGCHTTSMAGTWMSIVYGFGGMRVKHDQLHFNPLIPEQWKSFAFNIRFRGSVISVHVDQEGVVIENRSDQEITLNVLDTSVTIPAKEQSKVTRQSDENAQLKVAQAH